MSTTTAPATANNAANPTCGRKSWKAASTPPSSTAGPANGRPNQCYLDDGVRLLDFAVSNRSWKNGRLAAAYRQPFALLAETIVAHETQKAAGRASGGFSGKWLPGSDSNQRPSG